MNVRMVFFFKLLSYSSLAVATFAFAGCSAMDKAIEERNRAGVMYFEPAAARADTIATAELKERCRAEVANHNPSMRQMGPFRASAKAAAFLVGAAVETSATKTLSGRILPRSGGKYVAFVAPYEASGLLSGPGPISAGCSYELKDDNLVFLETLTPNVFVRYSAIVY